MIFKCLSRNKTDFLRGRPGMEGTGFCDDVPSVGHGLVDIRRLQVGAQIRKGPLSHFMICP